MLIDEVAREYAELDAEVIDYLIGPKYGYVEIEYLGRRALGVAYFPAEDMTRGHGEVPAPEKLPYLVSSPNMFNRTLGVALINAIAAVEMRDIARSYENLIDYTVSRCTGKKIAVVGNMGPIVRKLDDYEVYVFERNPRIRFGAYPDTLERRMLKDMDGVIISGTTFLNDSFDEIIEYSSNARFKAVVGPTAGLHPRFLNGVVDVVAGLEVVDIENVKQIIRLGGGRWDFTPYCKEYVIETENII